MAKVLYSLRSDEVNDTLQYALICMTRYGASWNTMHRKCRWKMEFTEVEQKAAKKIFARSHDWLLGRGVPQEVVIAEDEMRLWVKLGNFCGSI